MAGVVIKNLWKKYGNVEAVRDLNLEIKDGEFFSLLGPSGCGKTSTLRMIAGLEQITNGEIYIGDRLVNRISPKDRGIAMIFEDYALYPHMTAFENMAFPLRIRNVSSTQLKKKVGEVARLLDMEDFLDVQATSLGDGEKQRVSVGRALVREPNVFLMDEPISHLDAQLRGQMRGELKRLHKKLGTTVIYVTHDQIEAMAMADRIGVMNLGVLQQVGTPDDIYGHPNNHFVAAFIGEPPMNFMDCQLRRERSQIALVSDSINLPLARDGKIKLTETKSGTQVIMGVRPEHVGVSKEREQNGEARGEIYMYEPRTDSAIYTIKIAQGLILAETDIEFVANIGQEVWLRFAIDAIHIFDKSTGNALL